MCSQSVLDVIIKQVVHAAKISLGNKLDKVFLYGSYARGDYDNASDIDFMVLAHIPHDTCWREYLKISELTWKLDLEYDVLVSLNVTDSDTFYKYAGILPFYSNVLKEGVALIA